MADNKTLNTVLIVSAIGAGGVIIWLLVKHGKGAAAGGTVITGGTATNPKGVVKPGLTASGAATAGIVGGLADAIKGLFGGTKKAPTSTAKAAADAKAAGTKIAPPRTAATAPPASSWQNLPYEQGGNYGLYKVAGGIWKDPEGNLYLEDGTPADYTSGGYVTFEGDDHLYDATTGKDLGSIYANNEIDYSGLDSGTTTDEYGNELTYDENGFDQYGYDKYGYDKYGLDEYGDSISDTNIPVTPDSGMGDWSGTDFLDSPDPVPVVDSGMGDWSGTDFLES